MGKRITALILVAIFALTLGACGKKKVDNARPEMTIQQITDRKALIMGFYQDAAPFGSVDDKGTYYGFDLEMGREICQRLGVTLNLRPVSKTDAIKNLQDASVDFLGNNLFLSEKERDQVEETDEIFENRQVLVVKSDSKIEDASGLSGKKLGVIKSSKAAETFENKKSDFEDATKVDLESRKQALEQLKGGKIDALLIDEAWAYAEKQNSESFKIIGKCIQEDDYCIAVRVSDEELLEKINAIVDEMRKDGTLDKITKKCFGKDYATFH